MKVKLIYPPGWYRYNTTIPMGFTTLAGALRAKGVDVSLSDLELKCFLHNHESQQPIDMSKLTKNNSRVEVRDTYDAKKLVELAEIDEADFVGITVMGVRQHLPAMIISESAKKQGKKTILGGDFATSNARHIIEEHFIDMIACHDGYKALPKIISGELPENIKNLFFKKNGIQQTATEEYPAEEMPMPDYRGLNLEEYARRQKIVYGADVDFIMQYIANLGCVNNCTYCARSGQHTFSGKSPSKIVSEIMEMSRHGSTACKIEGNELNPTKKFLEDLAEEFLKKGSPIRWAGYGRPTNLDYDVLRKTRDAGCLFIRWGVESGSQTFYDRTRKGYNAKEVEQVLKDSSRAGLFNLVIFMVGSPYETGKEVQETIDFITRNAQYIDAAKINTFSLAAGSELSQCPDRHNIRLDPIHPDVFHETQGLNWDEKQAKVGEQIYRITEALVTNGMGQSGSSSDLVFTALLQNQDNDAAKKWLKEKHPYLFTLIPNYMVSWKIYHAREKPPQGSKEEFYMTQTGEI